MSRRSSVAASLTTASTCHSSPLPDDTFGDLFGTACETPGPLVNEFENIPFMDECLKAEKNTDIFSFDQMVNFEAEPMHHAEDFVSFDQHDLHDQDNFVIFSNIE
jgi:hypothetical protein